MTNPPDSPYYALGPLTPAAFQQVRLETVFDEFKWDPQIGDTAVLSDFPLVLKDEAWADLSTLAAQLATEAIAAERELLGTPASHPALGIPRPIRALWQGMDRVAITTPQDARIIRFDFHHTTDGWRISEANIDTPGGLIEAGGFTRRMAAHYPDMIPVGDPAQALVDALCAHIGPDRMVALVHATAYSDDHQMMLYLERALRSAGLRTSLINPAQLAWDGPHGRATLNTAWDQSAVDYLIRFFPAEWLPNLPRRTGWRRYFTNCAIPASNPTSALLVQSKRFPLTWDTLRTPIPTWRKLLPETRDPRAVSASEAEEWVFKPLFGRAGEGVTLHGITEGKAWQAVLRQARRWHKDWIAQRRFEAVPLVVNGQAWYPSIGVYTVNGQAVGIYGRMAARPLIDDRACDIAVFLAQPKRR